MKFPILEKFVNLLMNLKYEHQSIFLLWGGSNLILERGRKNQIFFLRILATVIFLLNSGTVHPTGKNLIFPGRYLKADHFEKKIEHGGWAIQKC